LSPLITEWQHDSKLFCLLSERLSVQNQMTSCKQRVASLVIHYFYTQRLVLWSLAMGSTVGHRLGYAAAAAEWSVGRSVCPCLQTMYWSAADWPDFTYQLTWPEPEADMIAPIWSARPNADYRPQTSGLPPDLTVLRTVRTRNVTSFQ
jgi:hypothetical protein